MKPQEEQADFEALLQSLFKVVESMKGTTSIGDEWLLDAEGLTLKFFSHCSSFKYLWTGVPLPIDTGAEVDKLDDIFTLSVVARAAYENMLVFRYLFASSSDLETRNVRYWAWQLSDLLMRKQIMGKWMVFNTEEHRKVADSDQQAITVIIAKLNNNSVFCSLSPKMQKRIKTQPGNWKIPFRPDSNPPSWADIGKEAGLNEHYTKIHYPQLCSYAHSSSLSILQLRQGNASFRNLTADVLLKLLNVAIAMLVEGWTKINPLTESVYSTDHRLKEVISNWLYFAKTEVSN